MGGQAPQSASQVSHVSLDPHTPSGHRSPQEPQSASQVLQSSP